MEDTARSWQLYFKDDTFSLDDRRVTLISSLCSFFLRPEGWVFLSRVRYVLRQHLVLYIDLKALQQQSNISDLDAAIELQPHECLGCLGAAVYECLFESEHYTAQLTALLGLLPPANYVHVRPYNVKSLHVGIRNVLSGEVGAILERLIDEATTSSDSQSGVCRKGRCGQRHSYSAFATTSSGGQHRVQMRQVR